MTLPKSLVRKFDTIISVPYWENLLAVISNKPWLSVLNDLSASGKMRLKVSKKV